MNRPTASRVALFAATSVSAMAWTVPAVAADYSTHEYDRTSATQALYDLAVSADLNSGVIGGLGFGLRICAAR